MDEKKVKGKSATYYVRCLHRDIGYLMLGLSLVYALSGVILIYKDTDFLKSPQRVEAVLPQHMPFSEVARELHLRRYEVTGNAGGVVSFRDGANLTDGMYDANSGSVSYVANRFPVVVDQFIRLHKLNSSKVLQYIGVLYGALLLFLALSSLFMFKLHSRNFRRGIVLSSTGTLMALVFLMCV